MEHGLYAFAEGWSPSFSEGIVDRTGGQAMLYLTCTKISSIGFAHYGISHAKDLGICGLW